MLCVCLCTLIHDHYYYYYYFYSCSSCYHEHYYHTAYMWTCLTEKKQRQCSLFIYLSPSIYYIYSIYIASIVYKCPNPYDVHSIAKRKKKTANKYRLDSNESATSHTHTYEGIGGKMRKIYILRIE